jgi:hypothetical protein
MASQRVSLSVPPLTVTVPSSPHTILASDPSDTASPLVHDGCKHFIQVRNHVAFEDVYSYRMCEPQILSFMNCGHHLEYHCTVGRSFQADEVHDFCTFNIPEIVTYPGMNPNLLGLCPDCRKIIEDHEKLVSGCTTPKTNHLSSFFSRMWKNLTDKTTVVVNMHSYPYNGWTSSAMTHRIPRYHCRECRLDDKSFRKMMRDKTHELRRDKRRRRLESQVYDNPWDIGM